jgi:cell division protein FtsL
MTVRRIRNNRKKGALLKLGLFIYISFSLFATVCLRAAVLNLEYELGELDKLRAELKNERKIAVAQRASFYSTEKIEKLAIKRLGMTLPVRDNVYYVKRITVAGPLRASLK